MPWHRRSACTISTSCTIFGARDFLEVHLCLFRIVCIVTTMSVQEPTPLPLTLGQQFAAARDKAGLDQDQLGEILRKNRTTISRWERDLATPPFTAVVILHRLSGWPLEFFARAETPADPGPGGGSVIDLSGGACNRLAQVIAFPNAQVAGLATAA